jgi:hypothetical protein
VRVVVSAPAARTRDDARDAALLPGAATIVAAVISPAHAVDESPRRRSVLDPRARRAEHAARPAPEV